MSVIPSTVKLWSAIAAELEATPFQPFGYSDPLYFPVTMFHPETVADFADKRGTLVLTDVSMVVPNGYGNLSRLQMQLTAYAVDGPNAMSMAEVMAEKLRSIGCGLCMPGQGVAGNFKIDTITSTQYNSQNNLYYRAVRFSAFFAAGTCGG